jgi:PhnB protein
MTTATPAATAALIQPYLFFNGRCEEAIDFYRSALDAEVLMLMRFKESPDAPPPGMIPPGWDDKVMHSCIRVGETMLMASDGCGSGPAIGGFSLSLTLPSAEEVDRAFAALADGGQVQMPLGETFWSPRFGMVTDQFGVGWMVTLPVPQE